MSRIFITTIVFFFLCTLASAIPQQIAYQGYLEDDTGTPIDTDVEMTFALYDVSSGGTALWSETYPAITVTDGHFSVHLGTITPVPHIFHGNIWLGITVEADDEMTPRTKFSSVPYAYRVETVDSASGGFIWGPTEIQGNLTAGWIHSNTGNYSSICGGAYNRIHSDYAYIGGGGGPWRRIPTMYLAFMDRF